MYLVIYEQYNEYNQFEGSWDITIDKFTDGEEAKTFFKKIKKYKDSFREAMFCHRIA